MTKFREYLESKYQEWRIQQIKKGNKTKDTLTEFSKYIGVSQSTMSAWMLGTRTPDEINIHKLGRKLGLGIYDSLDIPRPDPGLVRLENIYEQLTPKQQRAVMELALRYATESNTDEPKTAATTS